MLLLYPNEQLQPPSESFVYFNGLKSLAVLEMLNDLPGTSCKHCP